MANRALRVKALVGKNIRDILTFELKNPKIGLVSVNEVTLNSDNSLAKVYVSFIGAKYPHQNFDELVKCKGAVRSMLAKRMDVYKIPDLLFVYDDSYEKKESLERALAKEEADLNNVKKDN